MNLGYGGGLCDGGHLNFSNFLALLVIGSVQDSWSLAIADDKLHALGEAIVASAIKVNDSIRDIFHLECDTNTDIRLVCSGHCNRRVRFGSGGRL